MEVIQAGPSTEEDKTAEVCRMCLTYVSESPEFYLIEEDLQNIIFHSTGISVDVSDESRPLNMCSSCFHILTQFHEAKSAWIKNQLILDNQEQPSYVKGETDFQEEAVYEEDDAAQDFQDSVAVEDEYGYSVEYEDLQYEPEEELPQTSPEGEEKQENLLPAQTKSKRVRSRPRPSESRSTDKEKGKEIYQRLLQECTECGKVMEKNRMEGHMNKHRNIRPYVCDAEDCGKEFHCKLLLRLHKTSIHTGRSHPCDVCQKAFPSQRSLYSHKIRHTNQDKFQCDFCERRFNNANSLKRHLAIHSGIREYSCETCNSSFYRKYNLDVHIRTVHHKDKSYFCEFCPKKFGYARLLRDHMHRTHPEEVIELMEEDEPVE